MLVRSLPFVKVVVKNHWFNQTTTKTVNGRKIARWLCWLRALMFQIQARIQLKQKDLTWTLYPKEWILKTQLLMSRLLFPISLAVVNHRKYQTFIKADHLAMLNLFLWQRVAITTSPRCRSITNLAILNRIVHVTAVERKSLESIISYKTFLKLKRLYLPLRLLL